MGLLVFRLGPGWPCGGSGGVSAAFRAMCWAGELTQPSYKYEISSGSGIYMSLAGKGGDVIVKVPRPQCQCPFT